MLVLFSYLLETCIQVNIFSRGFRSLFLFKFIMFWKLRINLFIINSTNYYFIKFIIIIIILLLPQILSFIIIHTHYIFTSNHPKCMIKNFQSFIHSHLEDFLTFKLDHFRFDLMKIIKSLDFILAWILLVSILKHVDCILRWVDHPQYAIVEGVGHRAVLLLRLLHAVGPAMLGRAAHQDVHLPPFVQVVILDLITFFNDGLVDQHVIEGLNGIFMNQLNFHRTS